MTAAAVHAVGTAPAREPAPRRLGRAGRSAVGVLVVIGTVLASFDPFTLMFFLSYATVGALLVVRRPENAVSWVVLAIGFTFLTTQTWPGIDYDAVRAGSGSPLEVFLLWLGGWAGNLTFVSYLALTLLFPEGRLPPGRWRRPAIALLVTAASVSVLPAFAHEIRVTVDGTTEIALPNPIAVLPPTAPLDVFPSVAVVVLLGVGVVSMLVRYRRSSGLVRLQLRWLVASIAFVVIALMAAFTALGLLGDGVGDFVWIPVIVAYPMVSVAIGVAILRYRLYAIDRIISRTLSWALVTAILAAISVAGLVGLQAVLAGVTQGQGLAVAVSTLVAFALFQPIRRRVQAAVDRRFDRARIDAQRTAELFSQRLRDQMDLAAITAELERTVDRGVRPRGVNLWIRPRGPS